MRASESDQHGPACVSCGGDRPRAIDPINGFAMARCDSCGLRFVPPESLRHVDYDELYGEAGDGGGYDFYVKDAQAIREGRPLPLPKPRELALQRIIGRGRTNVLDIGCGVGTFLHALEQRSAGGRGITCRGVEPSGKAVALAREYLTCDVHRGVFHDHVFPGEQFDAITMWEVLEHISDPRTFLSMVMSRLNKGGELFLSTPNYGSSWMWNDVPRDPRSRPPVHVTFWDAQSLKGLLERAGLVDVEVKPMGYPVNPGARSGNILGKYRASVEAMLLPRQRKTLYARGVKG